MNQLYHIQGLCPDGRMGGAGFNVQLWPAWKEAVAKSNITQTGANKAVDSMGRAWLDGCGYTGIFDPDNCGFQADPKKPPGPNARPMFEPNRDLRVTWGEWGPHHINIPGNACGLDIEDTIGRPPNGRVLLPHNVDTVSQAHLLLVVFLFFADTFVLNFLCE